MNCKPGDICIVIKDHRAEVLNGPPIIVGQMATGMTAGRIVKVSYLINAPSLCDRLLASIGLGKRTDPLWQLEEPLAIRVVGDGWTMESGGTIDSLPDSILRPLPKLGDEEDVFSTEDKPVGVEA